MTPPFAAGVVFGYLKQTRVLNGVDFEVERGTIHGLIGPNGSGRARSSISSPVA